ncbi:V3 [Honeysuckle yellow vein virus]|uniref:V3 protein n=1 Tax=Honeysuckle yellow vein virus TaxID=240865 RepID=Q80IM5_9GEMI|nr:V3 [Honeysuckle yellow vein virus]
MSPLPKAQAKRDHGLKGPCIGSPGYTGCTEALMCLRGVKARVRSSLSRRKMMLVTLVKCYVSQILPVVMVLHIVLGRDFVLNRSISLERYGWMKTLSSRITLIT